MLSHTDKLLPPSTPSTRLCTTNYIVRKHIDPNRLVHLSTFSLKHFQWRILRCWQVQSRFGKWPDQSYNWIKGHMWMKLIYIVMGCAIIRSAGTTRCVNLHMVPGNFSVRLGHDWEELKSHIHLWYSNSYIWSDPLNRPSIEDLLTQFCCQQLVVHRVKRLGIIQRFYGAASPLIFGINKVNE